MPSLKLRSLVAAGCLAASLAAGPASARAPVDRGPARPALPRPGGASPGKFLDQSPLRDARRVQARRDALDRERRLRAAAAPVSAEVAGLLAETALAGTDRVLVVLVEFAGTNSLTWTPGVSTWDPTGRCDTAEYAGAVGTAEAATNIAALYGLDGPTVFTYAGPLHNQIPRPLSAADPSGDMIWTPDFSPAYYSNIIFGAGTAFSYTRQDGSAVSEDFRGRSVADYYADLSGGRYAIRGDIIGWVKLTNSIWWYGADPAPGARSVPSGVSCAHHGGIPGAGNARSLVIDALEAVKARHPFFNWWRYDQDGDGVIDRLWIIHAGLGEEDKAALLNRTPYGEAALWSHSSSLSPYYEIASGVFAGPYIMMPENCGIGVLAHEYGHNLGADDLYAYDAGDTSAGFWTLMADDWTGYPIGYLPPAVDPWHLDTWGWLDSAVIADPARVYEIALGQASAFPGGVGLRRGARIDLPDQSVVLPVQPTGSYQWWGGAVDQANARMTQKQAVAIPPAGAALTFRTAYDLEAGWDFLWVQVSADNGASWDTLTNEHTTASHDPAWIGALYGFPDDLAAAGIGGFSGVSTGWPNYQVERFSLDPYAGQPVKLRFWYMTDWGTLGNGPYLDSVAIASGATTLFSASADGGDAPWTYEAPWERNVGVRYFSHAYYLQWRNVGWSGGYDRCLGDSRWRFGPANSGLLVWYNNNYYTDNEVWHYLTDPPGFGPKGRLLVVDAHPEPYRDPYYVARGYPNEGANVSGRSQMRDAPFSREPSVGFAMSADWCYSNTVFAGRPAVSVFSDSLGYYPGAEYVSRGPGYSPPVYIWLTRQWDASAVVPALAAYGIRAPGYANDAFRFRGERSAGGLLYAYWYGGAGLGYNGGTGNPGEFDAHHGWNVKILSQQPETARVVIWNSRADLRVTAVDDAYTAHSGHPLFVGARGVLANDRGPAGATLAAERLAGPAHGALSLAADGGFTYTPRAGYVGPDRFTYRCRTAFDTVSVNTGHVELTVIEPPPAPVGADFDGDGLADPALYLEFPGTWKIKRSATGYAALDLPGFLGGAGWSALAADFDGDGLADPAAYAAATGAWRVRLSGSDYALLALPAAFLGGAGWSARAADFDGDGLADPAARRADTGLWQVRLSGSGYAAVSVPFVAGGGIDPVAADFDGDGLADPAAYAAGTGTWSVLLSGSGYAALDLPGFLGGAGWSALAADFDGDGLADPAAYAAATGAWRVRLSSGGYAPITVVLPF